MDIGVVGAGNIGANVARLFAAAGHSVAISNSRGPETLEGLAGEIGSGARAANIQEAAGFGDVVFVAIPFFAYGSLPTGQLAGKIVVDASNYYRGRDGEIDLGLLSSSEFVAQRLPGARVIKAFNTMHFETLRAEGRPDAPKGERLVLFVAGDDEEAKAVVSGLIEEIGFTPLDTGSLALGGRRQQPGSPIYNVPMNESRAREVLSGME